MSPDIISALAKLMAAIAPIVGAFIAYDLKRRALYLAH